MSGLVRQTTFARSQDVLNLVDDLRDDLEGEEGIELPSIAVVGNQSAGKSSVLERLSEVPLPRGDGMKTKCPLVMRLRGSPEVSIKIGTSADKLQTVKLEDIEGVIDKLTAELTGSNTLDSSAPHGGLVDKPLTMLVTGPKLPNLTLIDLPGMFSVDKDGNTVQATIDFIEAMYAKYISNPACVAVVVMPATEDSATQPARGIAKKFDPHGERTIGVLTKVDRCSDNLEDIVRRIQGEGANALNLKLGAVALRNPKEGNRADRVRDKADGDEAAFFKSNSILSRLDAGSWGIASLVTKVGQVQLDRYTRAIPGLRLQISDRLNECKTQLKDLPESPATSAEAQRLFARQVHTFTNIVRDITDLRYEVLGRLVRSPEQLAAAGAGEGGAADGTTEVTVDSKSLHIMPRLMELFDRFEANVRLAGSTILSAAFHQKVGDKNREVRGKSLDDVHLGSVFDDLVRDEIARLRAPAMSLLRGVHETMRKTVGVLVRAHFITSERLASAITNVLEAVLLKSKNECEQRIDELLEQESSPLTLNHYYAETLAKSQANSYQLSYLRELARSSYKLEEVVVPPAGYNKDVDDDNVALVLGITKPAASNGVPVASPFRVGSNAEEAIVQLQLRLYAYRKVVQKRFVDHVAGLLRLKFAKRLVDRGAEVLENCIRPKSEAPSPAAAAAAHASSAHSAGLGPRPRYDLEEVMAPSAAVAQKRKQLETSIQRLSKALERLDDAI